MKYLRITTLEKGYKEPDDILLHAAFQVLVDFIEKEKPQEIIDYNYDEKHKKLWLEISELYEWWIKIRPDRKDSLDDLSNEEIPDREFKKESGGHYLLIPPDKIKYAKFYKVSEENHLLEKKWFEEDQKNLHRLIDIRADLWS